MAACFQTRLYSSRKMRARPRDLVDLFRDDHTELRISFTFSEVLITMALPDMSAAITGEKRLWKAIKYALALKHVIVYK